MQSVKNTVVTIILLFLSYGVYQVITKPLPSEQNQFDAEQLSVVDSIEENDAVAENLNLPPALPDQAIEQNIPPKLLELPESKSFVGNSAGSDDLTPPTFDDHPSTNSQPFADMTAQSNMKEFDPGTAPNHNRFAPSQDPQIPDLPIGTPKENQTISYEAPSSDIGKSQFESDSQIIPSTVLGAVAQKPEDSSPQVTQPVSIRPRTLAETWPTIEKMVNDSQFQDALYELSTFYRDGNFNAAQSSQLMDWLDALAAKVIYSAEHHIQTMPYVIQPGDTIGSLARTWQIPAQLIYNVNSRNIPDPTNLQPGAKIKMIEGPFDADIDSQQGVMTLFLNEMYAGRFEIKSGTPMQVGSVRITDKSAQDQLDRPFWIALSNGGSIFASEEVPQNPNELGMSLREAEEIFSILSATSKIRILR